MLLFQLVTSYFAAISGYAPGTSTAAATLKGKGALAGTSSGYGAATGHGIGVNYSWLAGTADGSATVSATIGSPTLSYLTGTASGVGTASASLRATTYMVAVLDCASTASATLVGAGSLRGASKENAAVAFGTITATMSGVFAARTPRKTVQALAIYSSARIVLNASDNTTTWTKAGAFWMPVVAGVYFALIGKVSVDGNIIHGRLFDVAAGLPVTNSDVYVSGTKETRGLSPAIVLAEKRIYRVEIEVSGSAGTGTLYSANINAAA